MKTKPKSKVPTKPRALQAHMTVAKFNEMKERMEWAEDQFQKIKVRCKTLESASAASAQGYSALKEQHANEALAAMLVKQRLDTLLSWAALKRPDLLRLEKQIRKQAAIVNAGKTAIRDVVVNMQPRKRSAIIFDTMDRTVRYSRL